MDGALERLTKYLIQRASPDAPQIHDFRQRQVSQVFRITPWAVSGPGTNPDYVRAPVKGHVVHDQHRPAGSFGIGSCSGQRLKMSASTFAVVNPTLTKAPARRAPIAFTRPRAFQSCTPNNGFHAARSRRGARHIRRKATFINIYNGPPGSLMRLDLLAETATFCGVCYWMAQGLLCVTSSFRNVCRICSGTPRTGRRIRIGRRRGGRGRPGQASSGRSWYFPALIGLWGDTFRPAFARGKPHAKLL